jgi:hypothetical protein
VETKLVTPYNPLAAMFARPRPGGEKLSLEDKKRIFLQALLDKSRGVDAWKDASAKYLPDGRFEFQGTAYFKDLRKLKWEQGGSSPARLVSGPDGKLRLVFDPEYTQDGGPDKDKDEPPDPQKATDKELDDYIFEQKVEYQAIKPILRAALTDAKLKYVFRLPGEVSEVKVFRPAGKRAVSFEIEGNKVLKAIDEMFARDNAFFRKHLRAGGSMSLNKRGERGKEFFKGLGLDWAEATATVAKPTGPQFDYAKEAGAAREAYPALRKRLGLGEEKKDPFSPELKSP